jgi:hypothetical protein
MQVEVDSVRGEEYSDLRAEDYASHSKQGESKFVTASGYFRSRASARIWQEVRRSQCNCIQLAFSS